MVSCRSYQTQMGGGDEVTPGMWYPCHLHDDGTSTLHLGAHVLPKTWILPHLQTFPAATPVSEDPKCKGTKSRTKANLRANEEGFGWKLLPWQCIVPLTLAYAPPTRRCNAVSLEVEVDRRALIAMSRSSVPWS
jgi:hypothetical protein